MITLKLKYEANEQFKEVLLKDLQRQYSSCYHYFYNRIYDSSGNISEKELRDLSSNLNNIDLLDSWFVQCSIKEALQNYKTNLSKKCSDKKKKESEEQYLKRAKWFEEHKLRPIFGGRKNFERRIKGQISNQEWNELKLNPLYSIGEGVQRGNRKFRICSDLESILFKPNRNCHVELRLKGVLNRRNYLKKIYLLQEQNKLSISYKLSKEYIYISFDESCLNGSNYKAIENRVFGIDLNPNYIGWSVVDWKESSKTGFKIIKKGIISLKNINDIYYKLKGLDVSSDDPRRIYISNKRNHEVLEISKKLIEIALHYKCQIFSLEDLNIETKDRGNGKKYNQLVNNSWNRNKLVNNLKKRCNIFGIKFVEVKPEFSSFVGNFLFRSLRLPDMILSSIEIGRRGFEFYNQYITKKNIQRKNIVFPDLESFNRFYTKSLEEFGVEFDLKNLKKIYDKIKESKLRFRLSLDQFVDLKFSSLFSQCSKVECCFI